MTVPARHTPAGEASGNNTRTHDWRERVRVPHGFYAGRGGKVHRGIERRGDVVVLACGMSGVAFGPGPWWLTPISADTDCGLCLRSVALRKDARP